jgi:LEA14-like dessication related protein
MEWFGHHWRMKKRTWLATGLLLLAACAGLATQLETPEITFVGIRAVEASLFEQKLEVRLRVRNPNTMALPVNGLDVAMELAGEPFATGVTAREFVVPAHGEAEFDMIVTANAATALLKIAGGDRQSREEIGYRLKGRLSTKLGLLRSIPFEESGSLPLGDLMGKRR